MTNPLPPRPIGSNATGLDETGDQQSVAQIFDRGYRRYEGERSGVRGAIRSLVNHSLRHAMGIGRSARYKIIALLIVVMSYVPAVVFVGVAALIPIETEEFLPTYAQYYGFVAATIYLMAGFTSPELLCSDRRNGLLGVYLASPLTRVTYLIGKAIAVFIMLLFVTLGPPLLMLIAFSLQNMGPDGFVEWIQVFFRIIVSSLLIGGLYTAISMAIAASSDRVTVATAAILAIIPGSAVVTDRLVIDAGLAPEFNLANLMFLPRAMVFRVHGESGGWPVNGNPSYTMVLAWVFWFALSVAWVWYRYRRLLVRR